MYMMSKRSYQVGRGICVAMMLLCVLAVFAALSVVKSDGGCSRNREGEHSCSGPANYTVEDYREFQLTGMFSALFTGGMLVFAAPRTHRQERTDPEKSNDLLTKETGWVFLTLAFVLNPILFAINGNGFWALFHILAMWIHVGGVIVWAQLFGRLNRLRAGSMQD